MLEEVKEVVRNKYNEADCGLFFSRNWIGDPMETIYEQNGVTIDICYPYLYFEVFGLTDDEQKELAEFYDSLGERKEDE